MKDNQGLCVKHNAVINKSSFYQASGNSIYSGLKYIPICKNCIAKQFKSYINKYGDTRKAVYYLCRLIDIAYVEAGYESALKSSKAEESIFGSYMRYYNSIGTTNGVSELNFDSGEQLFDEKSSRENSKIQFSENIENIKMTEEDKEIKSDIIELLEYDPFEGYSESDQKFLYADLINYFGDEDVVEDQFLVSQIIQIVNNNNTIRKMDYLISNLSANADMLMENESKIKSITTTKKSIVDNNDKIAKENGISVNKRKDSNIKKSTLTATMEYLRSLNFDDAEIDFYDQKKSYGMQVAANVSTKAIVEELQFDENDIKEMLDIQRSLIKEMEQKMLDLEEESRKLHVKISEYESKK